MHLESDVLLAKYVFMFFLFLTGDAPVIEEKVCLLFHNFFYVCVTALGNTYSYDIHYTLQHE